MQVYNQFLKNKFKNRIEPFKEEELYEIFL